VNKLIHYTLNVHAVTTKLHLFTVTLDVHHIQVKLLKLRRHGKLESQSQILSINKNGFFYFQMFRNSKAISKIPQR
jgi:hypothetical protein